MYVYMYVYNTSLDPPPCRRHRCVLRLTPKAPVTISNHPVFADPVAVGIAVWRSSWSRSLQFQLESESGVSSLESCRGGPPPLLAGGRVDCYRPEAPNSSLQPSFSRMSLHQDAPTSPKITQKAPSWSQHRPKQLPNEPLDKAPTLKKL